MIQDLKDQGIPSLVLEVDDTSPAFSQLENRIQAFLEMVGGIF
ncbi:MAG: 2-hydroxyacyl-CoA dehydratase [Deltaproteobacteria bacterium]|nr:2-hydroxyacyl-CoA dehydratase [Deltaproteobacteria bacterium]